MGRRAGKLPIEGWKRMLAWFKKHGLA